MPINYADYNPEWPMLRELISHRTLNRCAWCRAPHRLKIIRLDHGPWMPLPPNGRCPKRGRIIRCVCTVAHLNHDRNDDRPENLALLCQRCHLNHDRPQHLHKRLKVAYRWRHPKP